MTETELAKAYEPLEVERRWYPVWMERGYFRAEPSSSKQAFCIVLPPPNVTGSLHLGHALTATIQDVLIRWKRMSGFNCLWLPGTDHAGIATQMVVEKELKRAVGKSRHDLGREEFLKRVWVWKQLYGERIGQQHRVLGASLDWSRERFTMDAGSSAAVREAFVSLYEGGLLYRAQKLINWCPSCHTALSDLEVEHEEKNGSLWYVRYPVKGQEGRFLTVATTRPETMLGDTAVAIHPDDPRYRDLHGAKVVLPLVDRELPVVLDPELVNMEFGTGVVKVTPGHDFNDYQTGLRHQLPMISIFDDSARTTSEAGPYAGLDRMDARKRVLEDLSARGLLEKEEPHKLSVGTCQRCGTVVEPRLSPQWFVKVEPMAKKAIQAVEQGRTRFVPESWTATFFNWMRNIHDWCVSRQLWWGHQIPAWYCLSCSPRQGDNTDLPLDAPTVRIGEIDLARAEPIVSREAPTSCPRCAGHSFLQDPDVLDTWFSSSLWPFSTLGWPERTMDLRTFYPNSVMETGHDIIFFWVARMMMMGLHFMNEVPFRIVYLHAMVRDEKGEKMSKTKGNVIDPLDVVEGATPDNLQPAMRNRFPQGMPAYGADALRFTLASLTQQGRDIKLSLDRVAGFKAFTNKLWNAARFALMNMGQFRLDEQTLKAYPLALTLADRWILARLNRAIHETRTQLEVLDLAGAASTLYQFVWRELCDWYIELAKGSLYADDEGPKQATRGVLVLALDRVLRLLHPFIPFITEEIWQKLPFQRPAPSIMVAPYPAPERWLEDPAAEAEMGPVVAAIEGIRTIRGEADLPPQTKVTAQVQSASAGIRDTLERWRSYVLPLAGLSELTVAPPGPKPRQSAAHVTPAMEIYVPLAGVIDLDAERARLLKEIARADADLAGLERKLGNPSFVQRAPAEVVQKDRERVEELKSRKAKLHDHLRRIAPEDQMPDETNPQNAAPPVSSIVTNPETAKVKIGEEAAGKIGNASEGPGIDLARELAPDLEALKVPEQVDPQVKEALEKLRQGTEKGLSPTDHYDLGVAYMGMGLVDDAVREFNVASEGRQAKPAAKAKKPAAKAKAKVKAKAAPKAKAKAKGKPKSKAGGSRKAVARKPARKK